MATRGGKRRLTEETEAPRPKRGRPARQKVMESEDIEPVHTKTSRRKATDKPAVSKPTKTMGIKRSVVIKPPKKNPADTVHHDDGQQSSDMETHTQRHRRVVGSITSIVMKSFADEKALMLKNTADGEIIDSEDEPNDDDEVENISQVTMNGDTDYTKLPSGLPATDEELLQKSEEESGDDQSQGGNGENEGSMVGDDDNSDESGDDGDLDATQIRMIEHDTSVFDDPKKTHEMWWSEDSTREETLCQLWQDEKCLYVMNYPGYKDPAVRDTVLKRFSTCLHVPREYM